MILGTKEDYKLVRSHRTRFVRPIRDQSEVLRCVLSIGCGVAVLQTVSCQSETDLWCVNDMISEKLIVLLHNF